MQEIKLRIIGALTRTDGTMARNDPNRFLASVDIIYNYVVQEESEKPKRGRPRKIDKA